MYCYDKILCQTGLQGESITNRIEVPYRVAISPNSELTYFVRLAESFEESFKLYFVFFPGRV